MIIPSSVEFFFAPDFLGKMTSSSETPKISIPITHLASMVVFKHLGLQKRQQIASRSGSAHLRHLNENAPHVLQTLVIGANMIEINFFGVSYHFTGGNQMTTRTMGGIRKEEKFQGAQDEFMRKTLLQYLNRRGTVVQKLFLNDQKAFQLLKDTGVVKKFEIKSSDGLLMRDYEEPIGQLPDRILHRIEWTLVDRRIQ